MAKHSVSPGFRFYLKCSDTNTEARFILESVTALELCFAVWGLWHWRVGNCVAND